jgi:ATP-dependent Clp protease protease subunit
VEELKVSGEVSGGAVCNYMPCLHNLHFFHLFLGMASDIEIQAREILRTRERLNNLYVEHTGQPLEDIERVMDRDTFMDVEQAKEFGVIDKILTKRPTTKETEDSDSA